MSVRAKSAAPRGVALINALLIVAALSAITVTLMQRSEAARARLGGMLEADQLGLYLDAAEQLAFGLLAQPVDGSDATHSGQPWAQPFIEEPIERGTVSLRISDLQGRFNLAWLNRLAQDEDSLEERAMIFDAFAQLMQDVGLDQQARRRLRQALDPDLGQRVTAWGRSTRPPTLPLLSIQQLRLVEGVSEDDLRRLAPHVTSLPSQAGPNLNTISPEVLAAFLPRANAGSLSAPLAAARPFEDFDTALEWIETRFGEDARERLEALDADVSSGWFELQIEARLDTLRLTRNVVVQRDDPTACCKIVLSLPEPE